MVIATLRLALLIVGFVFLVLAALEIKSMKANFLAAGLALWLLAEMLR
jgi:hypothetical protein